jgi:hypothetical protein
VHVNTRREVPSKLPFMSSSLAPLLDCLPLSTLSHAIGGSNIALLSGLLVARIDDRIRQYRYEQDDPDEILTE